MGISLELAIAAVRAGRREEGRQLLNLLIQQNPNNDKAWLWMSSVVDTDEQRARCLYHVLAIDPNSHLARRGLQVLGIVVSDSRPVKIPRDSQPIQIPKPSLAAQDSFLESELQESAANPVPAAGEPEASSQASSETSTGARQAEPPPTPSEPRRPFLVDPQAVTQAMPFMPFQPPVAGSIQASPSVLSIDVDAFLDEDVNRDKTAGNEEAEPAAQGGLQRRTAADSSIKTKTQKLGNGGPESIGPEKEEEGSEKEGSQAASSSKPLAAKRSRRPSAFDPIQAAIGESSEQEADPEATDAQQSEPEANPLADPEFSGSRKETRPSQPIPVNYPHPDMGMMPNGQMPYYPSASPSPSPHANVTQSMPPAQQMHPAYSGQDIYAGHANATMGMPLPHPSDPSRPPSEPVTPLHSNMTMGMMPYGHGQFGPSPQAMAFHSNSTMMMPIMTEAEARARLNASPSIPTANAAAMALQNGSHWMGMGNGPMPHPGYNFQNEEEEEEEGSELNVLAVIIFGTLSVTALGGFGMLILLMLTTPGG